MGMYTGANRPIAVGVVNACTINRTNSVLPYIDTVY